MENQPSFSEQDALQLIERTIKSARQKVSENGFIFLLWGWLIIGGYAASYAWLLLETPEGIGYSWMGIGLVGTLISFIHYAKKGKREGPPSMVEKHFSYIWAGVGLGAAVLYTYFIIAHEWELITPLILTMAGIATFISGRILKSTALTLGGISFWLGAGVALYFQSEIQFMIGAICITTGYLIPGYILKARSKQG